MAKLGKCWIFLLFMIFCRTGFCEDSRCTFPNDFSHRHGAAGQWLASRAASRRHVLDKWDRRQWSTIHQRLDTRANSSAWNVYESESKVEEFMRWVLSNSRSSSSELKFSVAYSERPWWRADGSQIVKSFAAGDVQHGDTLLNLPMQVCLSDQWITDDPKSLHADGAPWEVRLASKLLLEKAKGKKSRWASYIRLLPTFISLPIFFSDLELNNIQDKSAQDEVQLMRDFAKSTFEALGVDEIGGAKFGDYVWALSVVYSSVCQVNEEMRTGKATFVSAHYLVPFFSANAGGKGQVYVECVDDNLKLSAYDDVVKLGTPLSADYASTTLADTFLFRGFVPQEISQQEKIKVFRDVRDLVHWYSSSSSQSAVNHNKYLTLKLAEDAMDALSSTSSLNSSQADFSVGGSGYVDKYMIAILASLFYAKQVISGEAEIESFTTIDFIVKNGSTVWETILKDIAIETVSRYEWNMLDCKMTSQNSRFHGAFSSAKLLIQERLLSFMDAFATNLAEDEILLAAALWEGMNELGADQLGCPSCRWQTEQLSYNDNLAAQFRSSMKTFILHMISELGCGVAGNTSIISNMKFGQRSNDEKTDSPVQEFLDWCEVHNLIISDRLAVRDIAVPSSNQSLGPSKYRGVVALQDVHQGEVLCTLPMSVGLFDNDTEHESNEKDGWDLAAARLLREKAKGLESNYAPYINILPDYFPTPIHLESQEIKEVQWLPMMRELVQVHAAIKESYLRLRGEKVAFANFSEYQWAVTMVHSRAFTLPVRGDDQYEQYVLMPFMDMINHHYSYQADWISQDIWGGKLDIVARRSIRKGEELFASFGPRSNDNLFLYYGFVLEDNPFDSIAIFGSFEEALKWFLNVWAHSNCIKSSVSSLEEASCRQRNWQLHWSRIKDEVEEIENGRFVSGREWTKLLTYWANLGFQFLPYQPGAIIYPNAVIDPSLLAVFSAFHGVMENVTNDREADPLWPDTCLECGNNSAIGSPAMRQFFACIQGQQGAPHGLLNGHICKPYLAEVLLSENVLPQGLLVAKISVALRCLEILSSFATTVDQDKELLDSMRLANRTPMSPSRHLQLTWHYRYMKKQLLTAPLVKLLDEDN